MNNQAAALFKSVISSAEPKRIKLLGDSITHGFGGTYFNPNGENFVTDFRRNDEGYCWANLFRDFIKNEYGHTVINNGCCGVTIEFVIEHLDTLVAEDDDFVICTIGTNNRHQIKEDGPRREKSEHTEEFYKNILLLNERLKEKGKPYILIANLPASEENERDGQNYWRIMHMDDVNELYKMAAAECGFPFISFYDLIRTYTEATGVTLDELLYDGLHPNDRGYEMMAQLLSRELDLI